MLSVRLLVRLFRGGGRAGVLRCALVIFGVGIAVMAALFVATVPGALSARATIAGARTPVTVSSGDASFRYADVTDSWGNQVFERVLVADIGAKAPAPPGLTAFPAAGTVWVSPALARLMTTNPAITTRLPGRVSGTVSPDGLVGPDELFAYVGVSPETLADAGSGAVGWHGLDTEESDTSSLSTGIGYQLLFEIGVPATIFLIVCLRLSASTLRKRYAALRLIGMRRRTMLRIAASEAATFSALGGVIGALGYKAAEHTVASSGAVGFTWYAQRSTVSTTAITTLVVAVAVAGGVIGAGGIRRSLDRPLTARVDPTEAAPRWWLVLPLIAGVGLLSAPLFLTPGIPGQNYHASTTTGKMLLFGMLLSSVGILLAVQPIVFAAVRGFADQVESVGVRLGAKRFASAPAGISRLLMGLVALVLVAGIGAGFAEDAHVAAGPNVVNTDIALAGGSITPPDRQKASELSADLKWATISSVVTPSRGLGPPITIQDQITRAGVTMIVAPCRVLQAIAQVALPDCLDGHQYRLIDEDAPAGINQIPAGAQIPFHDAQGTAVNFTAPPGAITVRLGDDSPFPLFTVISATTQSPIGWPADSNFYYQLPTAGNSVSRLVSSISQINPAAQTSISSQNLDAIAAYRVLRGALAFGVWAGFLLGVLAFVVAMADRMTERRRDIAGLVTFGMRRRTIRIAQLVQLAVPLSVAIALAALVGNLVANALLRVDGRQNGWFEGTWQTSWPMIVFGLVAAAIGSQIIPGVRIRAEDLGRE